MRFAACALVLSLWTMPALAEDGASDGGGCCLSIETLNNLKRRFPNDLPAQDALTKLNTKDKDELMALLLVPNPCETLGVECKKVSNTKITAMINVLRDENHKQEQLKIAREGNALAARAQDISKESNALAMRTQNISFASFLVAFIALLVGLFKKK